MIIGACALQILRAAGGVALRDALAAAILDAACLFRPFPKPCVIVANVILEAKTDPVDLSDLGATPGRRVQADQQAMRPAVILRKIDEDRKSTRLNSSHANI